MITNCWKYKPIENVDFRYLITISYSTWHVSEEIGLIIFIGIDTKITVMISDISNQLVKIHIWGIQAADSKAIYK